MPHKNRKSPAHAPTSKSRNEVGVQRQVTLRDVANLVGVSLMTVSRAIKHPDMVSPKTLELVRNAIASTGYIPNRLAGGLSGMRTGQVAVLVPSLSNLVFSDMLNGMTSIFEPYGMQMMVGSYHYNEAKLATQISLFMGWSPDALVVAGTLPHDAVPLLRSRRLPVIEAVELVPHAFDCNVGIAHYDAGAALGAYLVSLGYTRAAAITANAGLTQRTQQRIAGLSERLCAAGGAQPHVLELTGRSSISAGRAGMQRILQTGARPEVVFCTNDDLAFGAITECMHAGLRVPQDIGVAGFNGLDIALQSMPSITTVKVDRYHMGELAAQLVLDRLGGDQAKRQLDIGFSVVPGQSTQQVTAS